MIVVTGGAGFIGSALVAFLNGRGIDDILVVDSLKTSEKWKNLRRKRFVDYVEKEDFLPRLASKTYGIPTAIVHLGACSSTTENDGSYLAKNNIEYSQALARFSQKHDIRFIYASSAATYGAGERGFSDEFEPLEKLTPLNRYGFSKHFFDLWLRRHFPTFGVGLKFFNVYGPNEYHKGPMRSVAHKAFYQIREEGRVKLFKSYRPDFQDGDQKRDFVYVKDCCEVIGWLLENPSISGLFNVGTGKARSWNDLANGLFAAMSTPANIEYIPMPDHLINQYQYFTQATIDKLRGAGYTKEFLPLEDGISDYVRSHLQQEDQYF